MPDDQPPPEDHEDESPLVSYDPWKAQVPGDAGGFTPSAHEPGTLLPPPAGVPPPGASAPTPNAIPPSSAVPPASQSVAHVGPPPATPLAGPATSPDGRFWWNGFQWVPVQRSSGGGGVAKVLLIGCGVLLLIAVASTILLIIAADHAAKDFHNIYVNSINQFGNNSLNQFDNQFGNDFANQFSNAFSN